MFVCSCGFLPFRIAILKQQQTQSANMLHAVPPMIFPYNHVFVPITHAQPLAPQFIPGHDVNLFVPNASMFPMMPVRQSYPFPMMNPQHPAHPAPESSVHHPLINPYPMYHVQHLLQHPSNYNPGIDMMRVVEATPVVAPEPAPVLQNLTQTLSATDGARMTATDTATDTSNVQNTLGKCDGNLAHCA